MKLEIRTKEQYKTSSWSGGQTTELYLYPPDGDYASRRFSVRLSSATVDVEESTFTKLPGIERKLMILEGNLSLEHTGIRQRQMKPYDVEAFRGDWDTVSRGKVRDFNLMVQEGIPSSMEHIRVAEDTRLAWTDEGPDTLILLYLIKGSGSLHIADDSVLANPSAPAPASAAAPLSGSFHLSASDLALLHGYRGEACFLRPDEGAAMDLAVCVCREI